MAKITRTEPEVISFDGGIKSDSPANTADFADMVNLTPPPDGSAGVIPRHPLSQQGANLELSGDAVLCTVHKIEPDPDVDPNGVEVRYYDLISVASPDGKPLALFPVFDVINSLPGEWENATSEYIPGDSDASTIPVPQPPFPAPGGWIPIVDTPDWVYVDIPPETVRVVMYFSNMSSINKVVGNIYYDSPENSWHFINQTQDGIVEYPVAPELANKMRFYTLGGVVQYAFFFEEEEEPGPDPPDDGWTVIPAMEQYITVMIPDTVTKVIIDCQNMSEANRVMGTLHRGPTANDFGYIIDQTWDSTTEYLMDSPELGERPDRMHLIVYGEAVVRYKFIYGPQYTTIEPWTPEVWVQIPADAVKISFKPTGTNHVYTSSTSFWTSNTPGSIIGSIQPYQPGTGAPPYLWTITNSPRPSWMRITTNSGTLSYAFYKAEDL